MSQIIRLPKKKIEQLSIGVIIQARMTSRRFPGKSMANLYGKPVIQWTIERAKKIKLGKLTNTTVVLAVPDTPESEPMLKLADKLKITNFCGSELNVLKRYYDAAKFFKFNLIIRITGDCPFIDPRVCTEAIQLLIWRKLDYVSNVFPERTYPKGLDCEAFTFNALEAAHLKSDQLGDYEHVTSWLQRTEGIRRACISQKVDMSHKNFCVDYPEDIARLEQEIEDSTKEMKVANQNDKAS